MTQNIYLEIIGKGPPLVLLHGWAWHAGIWQPLIPQLAEHYQLFLIDLPGCGNSPLIETDYTFESIADLIFSVVPEKADWLGWSLGGMLAWWVAIHRPEKINRLITVASSPRFVADGDWPGVPLLTLEKFSIALTTNYEKTLLDFLELQLRGGPHNQSLFTNLKKILFSKQNPKITALQGGLKLLCETDFRLEMKAVRCPSLHIFGNLDMLVPAKVIAQISPNILFGECQLIKPSGHIPFLSQQETFLRLLYNHTHLSQ